MLTLAVSVAAAQKCVPRQPPSADSPVQTGSQTEEPASEQGRPQSTQTSNTKAAAAQSDAKQPAAANQPTAPTQPPDAPSIYVPLSGRGKFNLFLRRTYSPYTFASAAFGATWAQMWGQWYQYGGGMQGWGKRFGASLADTEARSFIQTFVLSTLLHQDPRYFPSQKKHLMARAWYAGTRVLVTKNDEGDNTFNESGVLGALFTSSLQNAYYPRSDRGFGDTMSRFAGAVGSDATSNMLREFWPDIKRIFRKHEPERIKKMEQKIPGRLQGMAPQPFSRE